MDLTVWPYCIHPLLLSRKHALFPFSMVRCCFLLGRVCIISGNLIYFTVLHRFHCYGFPALTFPDKHWLSQFQFTCFLLLILGRSRSRSWKLVALNRVTVQITIDNWQKIRLSFILAWNQSKDAMCLSYYWLRMPTFSGNVDEWLLHYKDMLFKC